MMPGTTDEAEKHKCKQEDREHSRTTETWGIIHKEAENEGRQERLKMMSRG